MSKTHHKDSDRIIKLVHEYLGENSDKTILDEVADHMNGCPDCYIYINSVKQTIQLMKKVNQVKELPSEVEFRLYKSLKIKR
ncbi:MAG: hypothetical protein HOB40_11075 [Candidatus Marinimicrobia bacterium]|jgi:hypothetical protein|nr:hypothetical protein [Candidatus Neomarinimicrobiota bacterium]MBT3501723.1 hypothetical protein [Candidatus Neomarinimicrobiota bacterium]MBT3839692.1 hypothetical protein [Candidatus Neomarinimicrobiota bacterium]MBT3999108.1 hypothetical protein [Candidatus Neomarinimicrobiota bacterium]MBT4282317.1 hypothetical protein [Candidatus Neomarinimicrobiota bacterium]